MPPVGKPTLPSPTGDVVLYLHDPRRRNRQAAHGSRFKVKFVHPPKGMVKRLKCAFDTGLLV